jgi:mono/diheme cytochrome c family protein
VRKAVILVLAAFILLVGISYWYLTKYGFSARERPSALETMLARNARALATPAEARTLRNPLSQTEENLAEARHHFADHCAICHGNDGRGQTQIGSRTYPPAPDLRESGTQNLTDGEIFYIIKNGVRFTAMPGWGGEDEENWKLVLFIRHLPQLTDEEVKSMQEMNRLGDKPHEDGHHH